MNNVRNERWKHMYEPWPVSTVWHWFVDSCADEVLKRRGVQWGRDVCA
jgi:hypothetical protein